MTLNITLVSKWGIHQSSDFRLVDADQGILVSDNSPKLLQLAYQDWVGNVTYCGVGRWRRSDTSTWLKQWLTHQSGEQRTYKDVVKVIVQQGTNWLKDINQFGKRNFHTFIVTSFLDSTPLITLISNYQRIDSPDLLSPSPYVHVTTASINRRRLFVTGRASAVSAQNIDLLKSFGRPSVDTDHIQRVFARVNANSSKSLGSQGVISQSCWVYSNMPDGSSRGRLFGSMEGELVPIMLLNGMALQDQIQLNPAPGKQLKITASTFVTSESLRQKTNVDCKPRITHGQDRSLQDTSIVDVGGLGGSTSRVQAVNVFGSATGESFLSPSGPPHAFFWNGEKISDIGTLGGASSHGKDINDHSIIVGSSGLNNGDNHAFLWAPQQGFVDLGTLGGRHSHAAAINNSSAVVGASWTSPGQRPGNPGETAFIWKPQNGMRSLGTLGDSWSRAHDINDQGEIVGISPIGGFSHGFFYSTDGQMIDIGTLGGKSCRPEALNSHGQVVGMSEDANHSNKPFIWSLKTGMRHLLIPNAIVVRDINDEGIIVGDCETDVGKRSFIYSADTGHQMLPWYEHHSSEALGNANGGLVCGQFMGIEIHCHGVIWKL